MSIENAIASVAVRDWERATAWYAALFDRSPDSTPMSGVAEWKFTRGGWLQVYALPERAGSGSFTLAVTDIDEIAAHVQSLGVDVSQRSENDTVKTLMIVDPDGNHIAFAQTTDHRMAQ